MMAVAPFSFLAAEVRLVALARALRDLPPAALADPLARARAYADAGFAAWSGADDAEAHRRTVLYRTAVAPRQPMGAAA